MSKRKRIVKKRPAKPQSKSLFDHLNQITQRYDPEYWDSLSDADKKTFQPYMINRFLSMNPDWIEVVSDLQRFTVGSLSNKTTIGTLRPEHVFHLFNEILPKGRVFLKYVKAKETRPIPARLAEILREAWKCSNREMKENVDLLFILPDGKDKLRQIMSDYGMQLDEQKKIRKEMGL